MKLAREPLRSIGAGIEKTAGVLKNLAIVLAAVVAVLYYLDPPLIRNIANRLDPDRAWFFVGSWDGSTISQPRFHTGRARGDVPHDPESGLIEPNQILFPYNAYLAESIVDERDVRKTIVGRSKQSTADDSKITKVLKKGQCIYVTQSARGGDYTDGTGSTLHTIWAYASVLDCGVGY